MVTFSRRFYSVTIRNCIGIHCGGPARRWGRSGERREGLGKDAPSGMVTGGGE